MNVKKALVLALVVVLVVLLLGLSAVLFLSVPEAGQEQSQPAFSLSGFGAAGGRGYAVFSYRGAGNVTVISHDSSPGKNIHVLDDPQAIEATRLSDLVEHLKLLERYGYSVSLSNGTTIGDGIYVVPTGAIPSYVLFNLQQNSSNATIVYIGQKDLLLSNGIKRHDWYGQLTLDQQRRVVQYDGPLDTLMESGNISLATDILYDRWDQKANHTVQLSGSGLTTATVPLDNASRVRIVYELGGTLWGAEDSAPLGQQGELLLLQPQSIFPWEKSSLTFSLSRTNGTAFFSIIKDGKELKREMLRRVTDESIFIERLQYDEPGEYVLLVTDNNGTLANGMLHVKDLGIAFLEQRGLAYVFSVSVDGEPLDNTEAKVSIGNSSMKSDFYVTEGALTVYAKPNPGPNTFNIELLGTTMPVLVENRSEGLIDFYIKYLIPGLALVVVVYFGVRLTRRPTYTLKFGDVGTYIREESHVDVGGALEAFVKAREDMRLGKSPLTPHEFSMALKRYVTNGADVTEGNVEAILKKLVDLGRLETHRNYYQLKGEGDVKKNTLRRMVREKLIEGGIQFKDVGYRFITKDYEIGFFGGKFSKKALLIVDDEAEVRRILAGLDETERAKLKIKQANNRVVFVPINRLDEAL